MKNRFDRWFSARSVSIAERTSRRAFLGRLGVALVGSAAVPLLPVARNGQAQAAGPAEGGGKKEGHGDYNNEKSCDYWAYCSLDAWMCHCCGGSSSSCPPGAQMSPITWVGTCKNPNDDKESRMIEALTHLLVRHATPRPFVIQEKANRKYVQIANFCDQSQFTKRFKQLVGTTPGHFRNTPQYSTIQRLQLRIIIDLVFADHSYPEGKPCPVLSAWHHA